VKYAGRLVAAAFNLPDTEDDPPLPLPDAEPWGEPVDGAALLTEITALIKLYVALPAHAPESLAAFALTTHAVDAFNAASYLFLSSPTPECGKTRLLEVLELVVRRPWRPAILTGPVLFRGIEQYEPTLLLDEAEVVRGRGDAADNVRAVLHVGYRRGAVIERCVGEDFELRAFRTFGFKVFACIGDLPGTLLSRCIVIPMRRRGPDEPVGRFAARELEARRVELQRRCRRWAADHLEALRIARPELPDCLSDRKTEIWEPMLEVGLVEGGGWYNRLREAAEGLHAAHQHGDDVGVQLLVDNDRPLNTMSFLI